MAVILMGCSAQELMQVAEDWLMHIAHEVEEPPEDPEEEPEPALTQEEAPARNQPLESHISVCLQIAQALEKQFEGENSDGFLDLEQFVVMLSQNPWLKIVPKHARDNILMAAAQVKADADPYSRCLQSRAPQTNLRCVQGCGRWHLQHPHLKREMKGNRGESQMRALVCCVN